LKCDTLAETFIFDVSVKLPSILCAIAHVSNILNIDTLLLQLLVFNLLESPLLVCFVSLNCFRDKLVVLILLHFVSFDPDAAIQRKLILSELLLLVPDGLGLLLLLNFFFYDIVLELGHILFIVLSVLLLILGSIFMF